jgi:hypothetical protein
MLESTLFFCSLLGACLVMTWAARNDRHERQDLLSRLFALRDETGVQGAEGGRTKARSRHAR